MDAINANQIFNAPMGRCYGLAKAVKKQNPAGGDEYVIVPGLCAFAVGGICGVDGEALPKEKTVCRKDRKRRARKVEQPEQIDWLK